MLSVKRSTMTINTWMQFLLSFSNILNITTITRQNIPVLSYPGQFYVLIPTIVTDETKRKHQLRRMRKILKKNKKIRKHNKTSFFPKQFFKASPPKPYKLPEKNETTKVIILEDKILESWANPRNFLSLRLPNIFD